jgi:hypothetical protein
LSQVAPPYCVPDHVPQAFVVDFDVANDEGMHLARLELRAMYQAWFDHIGGFSLVADDMPAMRGGPIFHMKRLPLNLEPAHRTGAA